MWIELTDMSGEKITLNFSHVVAYSPYGTGAHIITVNPEITYFVRETVEMIQKSMGIEVTR